MNADQAKAIFILAGIEVINVHQIANEYWGNDPEMSAKSPWWLVNTPYGLIKLGWRKRVISIEWPETKARCEVTKDNVTKHDVLVHAYSYAKAVEYMAALKEALTKG